MRRPEEILEIAGILDEAAAKRYELELAAVDIAWLTFGTEIRGAWR